MTLHDFGNTWIGAENRRRGETFAPYSPGISVRDHIWLSGQVDVTNSDRSRRQEAL